MIDFGGNTDCSYHPKVVLNDASGVLRMDVTTDCLSALTCGEGGSSSGVTVWEFNYSDACGPDFPIDPAKAVTASDRMRMSLRAMKSSPVRYGCG